MHTFNIDSSGKLQQYRVCQRGFSLTHTAATPPARARNNVLYSYSTQAILQFTTVQTWQYNIQFENRNSSLLV